MHRPVCLSLACLSLALAALWPQSVQAEIVPHRAEYSLKLGAAANAVRVGTAIHDLEADCAGWRLKRDINVELSLTSAWKLAVGSKLDGEEARGGCWLWQTCTSRRDRLTPSAPAKCCRGTTRARRCRCWRR